MIKKLRIKLNELKEGYLDATYESSAKTYVFFNNLFIYTITILIYFIGIIFLLIDLTYIYFIIIVLSMLYIAISLTSHKAYILNMRLSSRILNNLFGKYGRVVTKDDWNTIKKDSPEAYKFLKSRKSIYKCYDCSQFIALYLQDAKLMYCSIKLRDGSFGGHSVILKNDYVYDTNDRMHYTLKDFVKHHTATIYKTFSREEYENDDFFENIKSDWISWCNQNNVSVCFQ